MATYLSTLNG